MADTLKREQRHDDESPTNSAAKKQSVNEKPKSKSTVNRWTQAQDDALRSAVQEFDQRNWKLIAERVEGRNHAQCLQRWNKVLKPGLVKGHWNFEEDSILERMVLQGSHSWGQVSESIPGRTAKQCRERWRNHLDPSIVKTAFTPEEDSTLTSAYAELGNRWTQIAGMLPGRTEDSVKMRWKALNPNAKGKPRPGRPKLMPSADGSKPRGTSTNVPPTPMETAVVAPPQPLHIGQRDLPSEVNDSVLTQSQRFGCMSLESFGGLTGLANVTPEELLASGDIDSLLKSGNFPSSLSKNPNLVDSFGKAIKDMENRREKTELQNILDQFESDLVAAPSVPIAAPQYVAVAMLPPSYHQPVLLDAPMDPSYQQMAELRTFHASTSNVSNTSQGAESAVSEIEDVNDVSMMQSFKVTPARPSNAPSFQELLK